MHNLMAPWLGDAPCLTMGFYLIQLDWLVQPNQRKVRQEGGGFENCSSGESAKRQAAMTRLRLSRLNPYRPVAPQPGGGGCLAGRPASELPMETKKESFVGWTLNGKGNFSVRNAFCLLPVRT
jgi:hypothetical protein